jgi:acetyl esterase/lipase
MQKIFPPLTPVAALLALLLALPSPATAGVWERLQKLRAADTDAVQAITYSPPEWPVPLHGDLYLPASGGAPPAMRPVVLLLHDGAWQRGDKSSQKSLGRALAAHGYAALAVNFRLAPQARFPAQLHDLQQALRWLQEHAEEYRLDMGRVASWGYSSGGHLAALLGMRPAPGLPAVRVVVAGGAPLDLRAGDAFEPAAVRALLGGSTAQVPALYDQASPMAQLRPGLPAFFLYHGTADERVPPALTERFARALAETGEPVELVWLEGLTHRGAAAATNVQPLALDYLDHHFGRTTPAADALQTRHADPAHLIRMAFPFAAPTATPAQGERPGAGF